MPSPAIGTFVKPVGRFGGYLYCLEIMELVTYESWAGGECVQWQCKRWGLRDGQPFDDGHLSTGTSISGAKPAAPGVWRDPSDGWCGPLYWRKIETKGQQDLFI